MDNPGVTELLKKPPGESIPQYMVDSREYMKANLFKAADAYRGDMASQYKSGRAAEVAANFEATQKKRAEQVKDGGDNVVPGSVPATSVANETAEQAKQNPATPTATASKATAKGEWKPEVADALGRTSHALEDFFAHSNFVELAIGQPAPVLGLDAQGNPQTSTTELASTTELGTGTFDDTDSDHALSHKIRGLADEIDREMPLVNRVAGKTSENPRPDQVHVGSTEGTQPEPEDPDAREKAIGTGIKAGITVFSHTVHGVADGLGGPIGGLVGGGLGAYLGFRAGVKAAIRETLITPRGTQLLRQVSEKLEASSSKDAKEGSHTKLAKDQGGHEDTPFQRLKDIKFKLARELATAADKETFGRMRLVFDAPTPEAADMFLQGIYTNLDQLIASPDGHPLSSVIDSRRKEAEKALEEYLPKKGDFPTPNPDVKSV